MDGINRESALTRKAKINKYTSTFYVVIKAIICVELFAFTGEDFLKQITAK